VSRGKLLERVEQQHIRCILLLSSPSLFLFLGGIFHSITVATGARYQEKRREQAKDRPAGSPVPTSICSFPLFSFSRERGLAGFRRATTIVTRRWYEEL